MHNMLKESYDFDEFYRYISSKLIYFFTKTKICNGDRFYLDLKKKKHVLNLYNVLKEVANENNDVNVIDFEHIRGKGSPYLTYAIVCNGFKIVIADSSSALDNYLVSLRNDVGVTENLKNSALVIICDDAVDSVYKGMKDLQKAGMPLNFFKIQENLRSEIKESKNLSRVERLILNFDLDRKLKESGSSLWDYKNLLSIIHKGNISNDDLKTLYLFHDNALNDLSNESIKKRLENNFKDFKQIYIDHQHDNTSERLSVRFNEKGVNTLKKETWRDVDYNKIIQFKDKTKRPLVYKGIDQDLTEDDQVYWDKPLNKNVGGLKKRHIIIFNEKQLDLVKLPLKFNKSLKEKFLNPTAKNFCAIEENHIFVNIHILNDQITFVKKITYNDTDLNIKFEFNIVVINLNEDYLKPIYPSFLISSSKKQIEIIDEEFARNVLFGKGTRIIEKELNDKFEEIWISDEEKFRIDDNSKAKWLYDEFDFNLYINNYKMHFLIKSDNKRPPKLAAKDIWDIKRTSGKDLSFNNTKVIHGFDSFYIYKEFKRILTYERKIISNKIFHGEIDVNDEIIDFPLNINEELFKKYLCILEYFDKFDEMGYYKCPSLTNIDSELEQLYVDFLNLFNKEIESIDDNSLSMQKNKLDLYKIGVFKRNESIFFSCFSPISIAYQLEVKHQLMSEDITSGILDRINYENIVPYISYNDVLYKTVNNIDSMDWIKYCPDNKVSIGSTNKFLSKVVKEKLTQFISHFEYLFLMEMTAPIRLNIININSDKQIVIGIFEFMTKYYLKNEKIIPIELNIYNNSDFSYFDNFFNCNDLEQFKEDFSLKSFSSKKIDEDIFNLVQNNITYYKNHNFDEYEYAHISFYKVENNLSNSIAFNKMKDMESGLSLSGLLSDVSSFNMGDKYRMGFGIRNIFKSNLLIETAINYNELIANTRNDGDDPYRKYEVITAKTVVPNDDEIKKLYESSLWVNFIEPSFGLEYFDDKGLIIVHYSDQYTSSNKYDTITVTNKHKQYEYIINQFLDENNIYHDSKDKTIMKRIVNLFNGINGEWLLKIVGDNEKSSREKLSIISALKYSLAILNHPNIIWIPISMEEILRIAGAVGLASNGLFDKNNLLGEKSDDLLFIGIEILNNDIFMHFHPVEVKEGIINYNTSVKAEKQLINSYEFISSIFNYSEENKFKNSFYRNFFVQIALSNFQKLSSSGFWNEKDIKLIEKIKPDLLNDNFKVCTYLEKFIKKGSVFAFKKEVYYSQIVSDQNENFQVIIMPDELAYSGISKDFDIIKQDIEEGDSDIPKEKLLFKMYDGVVPCYSDEDDEFVENNDKGSTDIVDVDSSEISSDSDNSTVNDDLIDDVVDVNSNNDEFKENIRIFKGTIVNSNKKLYWEYDKVANRNIFISGKSGYGKTYFLQCLIYEMSKQKVPTLIIDYSNSFTRDELQEDLVNFLENNLQYYDVKSNKFPLNPFKVRKFKNNQGIIKKESYKDVALHFTSAFSLLYPSISELQEIDLIESIIDCLNRDEEGISFDDVIDDLMKKDKSSQNIAKRIKLFTLDSPFYNGEFEWTDLDSRNGKVIVIQLSDYDQGTQKIITELILWDLWNYKKNNGGVDKPFNVVFDEAQNLGFSDKSPSMKILEQGRKHGWSAWFATLSLEEIAKKSISNAANHPDEMVFFYPTDNVKSILKYFPSNIDKNEWGDKLFELVKTECICLSKMDVGKDDLIPTRPYLIKVDSLKDRLNSDGYS